MIRIRRSHERGHFDHGWLDTYHTFSFADYHDPEQMNFRSLRVMNEDRIAPGMGFGTHGHRNMEIVTYVLSGALEHRDSMGNGEILRPGEFQRMSAGTGITHSEFNPSTEEPVHLYQIWILPERSGIEPSYEQRRFDDLKDQVRLVASPDGSDGSLTIHQDTRIYVGTLESSQVMTHQFAPGRHGWIQVLRGHALLDGERLEAGDGAAVSEQVELSIQATDTAEVMLFDLA